MEEDFDEDLADEGLPTGHDAVAPGKGILLLPHRQLHPHSQMLKARPSIDQEHHVSILPSHAPHSHLGGQDHGEWTYEEQFRQVPRLYMSSCSWWLLEKATQCLVWSRRETNVLKIETSDGVTTYCNDAGYKKKKAEV